MDNERLGHQRLDKPTGAEQRRGVGFVRVRCAREASQQVCRRHQAQVAAVEKEPHHQVSGVIENRADGPDKDDELGNLPDLPGTRPDGLLWADIIGRDGHLGKIVEEVVG